MSYYAMQVTTPVAVSGLGYYGGFGTDALFDPAAVYSAWLEQTTPAANGAVKTIQAALNGAGYGPLVVDGEWGSGSSKAFLKFLQDHNLPPISGCPGSRPGVTPVLPGSCPTKEGIAALAGGAKSSKAGIGLAMGLGIAAAGGLLLVGLALSAKKRGRA